VVSNESAHDGRTGGTRPAADLRDYLRVLWKRRWTIAGVLVVTVVSAHLFTSLQVPVFQASATIMIEPVSPRVVNIPEVTSIGNNVEDYYATQYKLIQSRPIIEGAIARLKLKDRLPAVGASSDPYLVVLSGSSVEPVKNTRLAMVRFDDPDPVVAADVANGIAGEYVRYNLELKQQMGKEAVTWLNQQLTSLSAQAQQSSKALQSYQVKADLLGVQEQRQLTQQKIVDLSRVYQEAQHQRMVIEAKLRELSRLSRDPAAAEAIVTDDPLIRKLKAEASDLQIERSKLGQISKDKHPDIMQIDAQIRQVNLRLQAEVQKLLRSVETEHKLAKAREDGLLASVNEARHEARRLNEREAQALALQREKESSEDLYTTVLKRMKEAGVATALEANNIRIVEAATPPLVPAKPRTRLIRILSVIAGLGLGIGVAFVAESLDNKIRSADDVERAVGLPILGVVPIFEAKRQG
jgi:polysaccharide biosynthesis transport protein